jgi:hypothetical protein
MPPGAMLADGPRDRRVGHAGYDDLAAHLANDALTYAEPWRLVITQQPEAFGVFHQRGPIWHQLGAYISAKPPSEPCRAPVRYKSSSVYWLLAFWW